MPDAIRPEQPGVDKAAGVLFVSDAGKLLLMRRLDGQGWAFPGGGIEEGETAEQAARREVQEETGLEFGGKLEPWTRRILNGVDFTTFVAKTKEFEPKLNDEHDSHVWAPLDFALGSISLHPGVGISLNRFSMDELAIAKAIVSGELTSPQRYANLLLIAIRITGTGAAYRSGSDEYAWRDSSLYMTEEFLQRCNGLPVIWEHPKKRMLNSKEFNDRIVGTVFVPYLKQPDEVWAIAKIYDAETGEILETEACSSSPGVVLQTSIEKRLEDGSKLVIEGKARLLDHICLVALSDGMVGVWDKGNKENLGVDAVIDSDEAQKRFDGAVGHIQAQAIQAMYGRPKPATVFNR